MIHYHDHTWLLPQQKWKKPLMRAELFFLVSPDRHLNELSPVGGSIKTDALYGAKNDKTGWPFKISN